MQCVCEPGPVVTYFLRAAPLPHVAARSTAAALRFSDTARGSVASIRRFACEVLHGDDIENPTLANRGGEVVKRFEAVHRRPGMYIGDTTDGSGLVNMVDEVVDNAINEALAGHCDRVDVALNADGSVTVRDNGRGIPTGTHEGVSLPEVIMTRLHASSLFEQSAQQSFGRLHGVGVAVVNALSEALDLRIWRDGKEHVMRFRRGDPEAPLAVVGNADMLDGKPRRGTEITFRPSTRFFAKTEFDFARIERRLRELACLDAGVTIMLADKRGIEKKEVVLRI